MLLCWLFRNRIEREFRNLADSHVLSIITAEMSLEFGFHNTETRFHQVIYSVTPEKSSPESFFSYFLCAILCAMADAALKMR